MLIKLKKSLIVDEKSRNTLHLDFDKLTGNDIIEAEREARLKGEYQNPLHTSQGYAIVAGKASGIIPEDICSLSAPDFVKVTGAAKNFLLEWVLEEQMELSNSDEQL